MSNSHENQPNPLPTADNAESRQDVGVNRRGFLKISSVAAAAAAVAATGTAMAADRSQKRAAKATGKPRATNAPKDHKGAWFIV